MKLYRGVLALVMMVGATATTGCKLGDLGGAQGDAPDPGDPGAQAPNDGPRNGGDNPGMRRARRHRGPGHRGRWNGRPRQGRGQDNRDPRDNPGPQGPPQGQGPGQGDGEE